MTSEGTKLRYIRTAIVQIHKQIYCLCPFIGILWGGGSFYCIESMLPVGSRALPMLPDHLGGTSSSVFLETHTWEYTWKYTLGMEIHTWRYTHGDTLIRGGVENNENHQEVARTFSPKTWTRIAFVWGGPPPLYFWVGGLSLRASESNESNHASSAWNTMEINLQTPQTLVKSADPWSCVLEPLEN